MAKSNKQTIRQLYADFGLKVPSLKEVGKFKDMSNEEVYKTLQKKYPKVRGKQNFQEYFSRRVADDPKSPFAAEEKEYQQTFGVPSSYVLQAKETEAQQKAGEYFRPDFEQLASSTAEQRRRMEEDAGLQTGSLEREYNQTIQDLQRAREQAQLGFAAQQQQNTVQDRLQQEQLIGDINASGQFGSSLQTTRTGDLTAQQQAEIDAMNRAYENQLYGLDTSQQRATQSFGTGQEAYKRQQSRELYDLNQLEAERKRALERSQQGYGTEYLSGQLQDIAGQSQSYYDRQATTDNDAAKFLEDYSTLGI